MMRETFVAEVKKILHCPSSHDIEIIDSALTEAECIAANIPYIPIILSHTAIYPLLKADGKQGFQACGIPIAKYTWSIITTDVNPKERNILITEMAHAIITAYLAGGVPNNHPEAEAILYPKVK